MRGVIKYYLMRKSESELIARFALLLKKLFLFKTKNQPV